jgi:hypothetical protein
MLQCQNREGQNQHSHRQNYHTAQIKLTRPQFIEIPSFARSPVAPVLLRRSDPARSTKWNLAVRVSNSLEGSVATMHVPSSCA